MCARSTLFLAVVILALLVAVPAQAGQVMIFGHDPDDHGQEDVYAGVFDSLLANVTNGGTGILAIGADPKQEAGLWIRDVARRMVNPQVVTFIRGGAISTASFDGYAIIHVPSDYDDTEGGITQADNSILVGRAADIETHVNGGGALFGLTQGDLPDAYGWLAPLGTFTLRDVGPDGKLPSGSDFDNVSTTPEGLALGITDTNLDGCCWHTVFLTYPSFLQVLATATEPRDPLYDGYPCAIGGTHVIISQDLEVALDIKPRSCPNPINPKSQGVLPAAILGTADFDVTEVDVSSLLLMGIPPIRFAYDDVAAPYDPPTGKDNYLDCTRDGPDGHLDLTVKFDMQSIVAAAEIALDRPLENGEVLVLPLVGKLQDSFGGDEFKGEDVVIIRLKVAQKGTGAAKK